MVDEALNQNVQTSIMEKFKKIESDKFNQEFKNKYLIIINELKKRHD